VPTPVLPFPKQTSPLLQGCISPAGGVARGSPRKIASSKNVYHFSPEAFNLFKVCSFYNHIPSNTALAGEAILGIQVKNSFLDNGFFTNVFSPLLNCNHAITAGPQPAAPIVNIHIQLAGSFPQGGLGVYFEGFP
jgi:hypothetical protein